MCVRVRSFPWGPVLEYATERPADTIELRIYPGENGQFTLYEDGNDGYQYEKGAFATTQLEWDDARKQLKIYETKGSFPGMLKRRVFRVVIVKEGYGVGVERPDVFNKTVEYSGKEITVEIGG